MKISNKNKNKVIAAAKRLVEHKKLIKDYSNGKISKKELNERGVRLAMPLQS